MEKEKFNEKDEKNMKGISKALYIITKICKIFTIIGIVGMGILMLVVPVILNKIEVKDNEIRIEGIEETLKLEDLDLENEDTNEIIGKIGEFFNKTSKVTISIYVEVLMLFVVFELVVYAFIYKYLSKLFKNINKEDTPFTFANAKYLRKAACGLIIILGIGIVSNLTTNLMFDSDFNLSSNIPTVLEALFIFAMAYVFKYGASMKETKKIKNSEE